MSSTNATNSIVDSSNMNNNNTGRVGAIGSVEPENLKEPPILNILLSFHPKIIPSPRQENPAEIKSLKEAVPAAFMSLLKEKAKHNPNLIDTSPIVSYQQTSILPNRFSAVFHGLNISESGGYFPADAQLAVGQRHIVEMVNLAGKTWLKRDLSASSIFALDQFFRTGSDTISSPRVVYDNGTGRWFAAIQDITKDSIRLAVSSTDDPQGKWIVYNFPFDGCPDHPGIAISHDNLVIRTNDFANHCTGPFSGAQYTVVDKNDLLTGYSAPRKVQFKAYPSDFSLHPVRLLDANLGSDLYMVSTGTGGGNLVKLYSLSGKVPFIKFNVTSMPIQQIAIPPQAKQPNTDVPLDTGDSRVLDAAAYKGKLWFTSVDACVPLTEMEEVRSCIVLVQIDIKNNRIIQDFDVSISSKYMYNPALTIDASGNLHIIFGMVSRDFYPSVFVSGQNLNSPLNTLNSPVYLTTGAAPNKSGRSGDYVLTNDPYNPLQLWAAGEYNNSTSSTFQWSTFIGNYNTSSASRTNS